MLTSFVYYQNNSIVTTTYTVSSKKIPPSFNGYKIVQLSDLHSKSFGDNQGNLVEKIKKVEPDLIVFTGDLVDSRRYDDKPSLKLMRKLVKVAPVYYVTGNHEWKSGKFSSLANKLEDAGVHVMRNVVEELNKGNEMIHLLGMTLQKQMNLTQNRR